MEISFIMPGRDNLKYAKWSYDSVRKHQGHHTVQICFADDNSSDGTWEWCEQMMRIDPNFTAIRNNTGKRLGHTILYDRLVNEVARYPVAMIWHCDMYLCPGALDEIEKLMYTYGGTIPHAQVRDEGGNHMHFEPAILLDPNYKTIVSLTRIEPPLHPDGPEKYLADWGTEPEDFNETAFLQWFTSPEADGYKPKFNPPYTDGVFAPWAFFVKDFKEIGGHDPLYRPQSLEDSDLFNRFKLNRVTFIQTWTGCVYHMTCRGSRFNPTLTTPGKNSAEWEAHNIRSHKNFIRKWGGPVDHTRLMNPIVHKKFNISYYLLHTSPDILSAVEPFAYRVYVDCTTTVRDTFIRTTQPDTDFDLEKRVVIYDKETADAEDILITVDCRRFTHADYQLISDMQRIVADSGRPNTAGSVGASMHIRINQMTSHETELIHTHNEYTRNQLLDTGNFREF